jgi:hypothetical protein
MTAATSPTRCATAPTTGSRTVARADHLLDEGRAFAQTTRQRGSTYGRQAVRYADDNRTSALLGLAAVAFAVGWLSRRKH